MSRKPPRNIHTQHIHVQLDILGDRLSAAIENEQRAAMQYLQLRMMIPGAMNVATIDPDAIHRHTERVLKNLIDLAMQPQSNADE